MQPRAYRRYQRGFGLLETVLSTVLAGLLAIGFWTLTRTTQQQDAAVHRHALLTRVDLALVAYAFEHGRLPCPAIGTSGTAQANCAPGAVGRVPYGDLGLPDGEAGAIQYTVQGYPQANQVQQVNLTVDNTGLLQLLVGQTSLHPTPALVRPQHSPVTVAQASLMAICSVLTAPVATGQNLAPAYRLQLQARVADNGNASSSRDLGSSTPLVASNGSSASNRDNSRSQSDNSNRNSTIGESQLRVQSHLALQRSAIHMVKVTFRAAGGMSGGIVLASMGSSNAHNANVQPSSTNSRATSGTVDTTRMLNRSFAELSIDLGCPALMSTGTRALFNSWLSAQVLLASLSDYQALLQVIQASAIADLTNGAIPLVASGPAKVGAKVMNLLNANGEYTKKIIENPLVAADFTDVGYAIADLAIESIYEVMNGAKMVRFAMNEINAANFNYSLSQLYMAMLAVQIDLLRQHAVSSLANGVYL
ncbi:type II secretion system protein [Burkholderia territorii]|nr:hypothetical protein [Burkholderia territorii]